jgi:hypothetical protein
VQGLEITITADGIISLCFGNWTYQTRAMAEATVLATHAASGRGSI